MISLASLASLCLVIGGGGVCEGDMLIHAIADCNVCKLLVFAIADWRDCNVFKLVVFVWIVLGLTTRIFAFVSSHSDRFRFVPRRRFAPGVWSGCIISDKSMSSSSFSSSFVVVGGAIGPGAAAGGALFLYLLNNDAFLLILNIHPTLCLFFEP